MSEPLLPRGPTPFGFVTYVACVRCGTSRPVTAMCGDYGEKTGTDLFACLDDRWCSEQVQTTGLQQPFIGKGKLCAHGSHPLQHCLRCVEEKK